MMLIKKQRRSLRGCIQDLHIDNKTMSGEENILEGFKNHFANLSMPSYDQSYRNCCLHIFLSISSGWSLSGLPSSYHFKLAFFISLYASDMFLFQICSLPSFFFLKYQELVEVSLANQNVSDNIDKLKSKRDVEEKVTKVSEVLKNSALECIPGKKEKEKTWQTTNLE
jgi:hypothetical protein